MENYEVILNARKNTLTRGEGGFCEAKDGRGTAKPDRRVEV